jgi:predicted AlkP superfamily phosphohydrolase/phosphomutase
MTNAQSILRDLKRRANQYRLSRADEYARTQLMTNAKDRDERLKVLNRALDALFDELKQRLEALPTVEQRQKATTAEPAKGSRK